MYLNWDVVLKKRTTIVILSIRKLKNVPAEFQGLCLEVQPLPSWCLGGAGTPQVLGQHI